MSPSRTPLSLKGSVRRLFVAAGAAVLMLGVASCGGGDDKKTTGAMPSELTFSILSAEGQASSGPLWQPLLDDMSEAIGIPVKPFFAGNYNVLIEAMRGNQTQVGWFSAKPAVEAVDRAKARGHRPHRRSAKACDSYQSTLIVQEGLGHHAGQGHGVRQAVRLRHRRRPVDVGHPGPPDLPVQSARHGAEPVLQDGALGQPPGQRLRRRDRRDRRGDLQLA
jgi:hypothetical protein